MSNSAIVLARLAAAERRIEHLETFIATLEQGIGAAMRPPPGEPAFVRRLRELDEQDTLELSEARRADDTQ